MTASGERTHFGRFDIIHRLGKGGMCEVYKAQIREGLRAGELVAIKRLLPEMAQNAEAIDMFLSEADLSRILKHPNIIEVIETGEIREADESYYIAMEFVDGRDLSQILERCRSRHILLPVEFAVYLVSKLLEALHYAHHARTRSGKPLEIVHRDVSPGNVFVSRLGEVKLGDFGIARMRASAPDEGGGTWGKPYYLPPEALRGEEVTTATDLWAAGVILYELLTDKRPFRGQTLDQLATQIQQASPRSPRTLRPGLPDKLAVVALRALLRDPMERYHTAEEFRSALAPYQDDRVGTPMAIAAVVRGLFGG